jgi:hypothetical protein
MLDQLEIKPMVKYFRYLHPINEQMHEAWLANNQANGESLQVLTAYQRANV